MKRRIFELWEQFYYLKTLRADYIQIKKRSAIRKENRGLALKIGRNVSFWILIAIVLFLAIIWGYKYPSVGFSDYTSPTGDFQRGKTLWDWIQLLVIPLILAGLAYYFTGVQKDKELAIAQIEKSEETLQRYFEYMTKLLIEQDYSDEESFEGAARFIRARTLTTLEMLNGKQKGYVLHFLIEAGLLDKEQPYFSVRRANLSGLELEPGLYSDFALDGANLDNAKLAWCNFQDVRMNSITMMNADLEEARLSSASLEYILLNHSDLYRADLSKAKLYKADLRDANFEKADLRETILSRSNLRGANLKSSRAIKASLDSSDLSFSNLTDTDLEEADLTRANFYGANLRNANLTNANLTDANITERQLRKAKSFQGAKLPSNIKMDKLK